MTGWRAPAPRIASTQLLGAGRRPPGRGPAAVAPAGPGDVPGLVEHLEHRRGVVLEGGRDAGPERRGVVGVRRDLLAGGPVGAGSRPVQVQDRRQTVAVQASDEVGDRGSVGGAAEGAGHAVDVEPAVLVERDPDRVGAPGGDRVDRRVVDRAVEQPPALDAGVLGTRSVHAGDPQRSAGDRVGQARAGHHRLRRRRGGLRRGGEQGEGADREGDGERQDPDQRYGGPPSRSPRAGPRRRGPRRRGQAKARLEHDSSSRERINRSEALSPGRPHG